MFLEALALQLVQVVVLGKQTRVLVRLRQRLLQLRACSTDMYLDQVSNLDK